MIKNYPTWALTVQLYLFEINSIDLLQLSISVFATKTNVRVYTVKVSTHCEPDGLRTVRRPSVQKFFVPPNYKLLLEMVSELSADSLKFVFTDIPGWSTNLRSPVGTRLYKVCSMGSC